ncbi:MAG: BREX-1 system adenine-specific DNA-methyltransferase PglX [Desulfobacterales bacterium]|nr:BREX-1 system adenine-specific DNA-methyltransferase PglX [Desulfobacterales bacterium]MBF0398188.1 BREX-1 system adenine-specific DNA-methyltransferase PglX [Desulfobacterales bacterium]
MSNTNPNNPVPNFFITSAKDFKKIPGSPIAYWVNKNAISVFENECVDDHYTAKKGMAIGDNARFLRFWHEVSVKKIKWDAKYKEDTISHLWYPCLHGGGYRKWSSNKENIVNWRNDGEDPKKAIKDKTGDHWSRYIISTNFFFKPGINWTAISSASYSSRFHSEGLAFTSASMCAFRKDYDPKVLLLLVNSIVGRYFLNLLSPTINYGIAEFKKIPLIIPNNKNRFLDIVNNLINTFSEDWDSYETSWDFTTLPLLQPSHHQPTLKTTYSSLRTHWRNMTLEMQRLEEENNRIFIEAYGLQDELTPDVPLSEITLTCNPYYRYDSNKTAEELETLLLTDTIKELISYSIGCMMGRYSLDHPGLIYAHSGNIDFDLIYSTFKIQHSKFPPDDDGIIPIMDQEWFPDDVTNRFIQFLKVAWTPETLNENLKFVADSLKPKTNETPVDTIRRYMSTGFFKDHLKIYKKRPIYWLFSSGKQKAFECLVYLHRYNESTLSRMRSAYVTPLQGHYSARIEFLENEKNASKNPSDQRKLQKEMEAIRKKLEELRKFDDELRHYADMKIALDLDDGVKVNYGKFGNLLAEKSSITGSNDN